MKITKEQIVDYVLDNNERMTRRFDAQKLEEMIDELIKQEKLDMIKSVLDKYKISCDEDIWQSSRFEGDTPYEIVQAFYEKLLELKSDTIKIDNGTAENC